MLGKRLYWRARDKPHKRTDLQRRTTSTTQTTAIPWTTKPQLLQEPKTSDPASTLSTNQLPITTKTACLELSSHVKAHSNRCPNYLPQYLRKRLRTSLSKVSLATFPLSTTLLRHPSRFKSRKPTWYRPQLKSLRPHGKSQVHSPGSHELAKLHLRQDPRVHEGIPLHRCRV
jgi:hypothetical protein